MKNKSSWWTQTWTLTRVVAVLGFCFVFWPAIAAASQTPAYPTLDNATLASVPAIHFLADPIALNTSPTPESPESPESPGSLDTQSGSDVIPTNEPSNRPAADFAKNTWSFQTYGSVTFGSRSGRVYLAHIGAGYFLFDGFSINLEGVGGGVRSHGAEAFEDQWSTISGYDLLARWHIFRGDGWSIYAEGGAGMIYASHRFPKGGTHFNFTPQAGFGGTLRILGNARLMVGCRYHHISNASIHGHDKNPGFDGWMGYAGLMIPF